MKNIKKCPLFLLIIVSSILFGILKSSHSLPKIEAALTEAVHRGGEALASIAFDTEKGMISQKSEETFAKAEEQNAQTISENDIEQEKEVTYHYEAVADDYFGDTLFIGDSRVEGLREYSKLQNATFYTEVGMTIHTMLEKPIVPIDGQEGKLAKKKITVEEALRQQKFGKIYLMVGINELGRGTPELFREAYQEVITRISELQPEAIIIIQSIMHVSEEKSEAEVIFNNKNIMLRNQEIQKLADNQTVFYLDMNEKVCDENGNLYADYSFDGVHLKAKYYVLWEEYLKENGIIVS